MEKALVCMILAPLCKSSESLKFLACSWHELFNYSWFFYLVMWTVSYAGSGVSHWGANRQEATCRESTCRGWQLVESGNSSRGNSSGNGNNLIGRIGNNLVMMHYGQNLDTGKTHIRRVCCHPPGEFANQFFFAKIFSPKIFRESPLYTS